MECTILSPLKKRVLSITWLDVTTDVGNFVIEQGHIPALLIAEQNTPLTLELTDGSQENFTVNGLAIVHILRDRVTILLSQ